MNFNSPRQMLSSKLTTSEVYGTIYNSQQHDDERKYASGSNYRPNSWRPGHRGEKYDQSLFKDNFSAKACLNYLEKCRHCGEHER